MASGVLTEPLILAKSKNSSIHHVQNLNIWGCELRDLSLLQQLPNLVVLSCSVNKIDSLQWFSTLEGLQELYLRKNLVSNPAELVYLQPLRQLRVLWLSDNPIADRPDYRQLVIRALPQLTKLDNVEVSQAEVVAATSTPVGSAGSAPTPRSQAAAATPAKSPSAMPRSPRRQQQQQQAMSPRQGGPISPGRRLARTPPPQQQRSDVGGRQRGNWQTPGATSQEQIVGQIRAAGGVDDDLGLVPSSPRRARSPFFEPEEPRYEPTDRPRARASPAQAMMSPQSVGQRRGRAAVLADDHGSQQRTRGMTRYSSTPQLALDSTAMHESSSAAVRASRQSQRNITQAILNLLQELDEDGLMQIRREVDMRLGL